MNQTFNKFSVKSTVWYNWSVQHFGFYKKVGSSWLRDLLKDMYQCWKKYFIPRLEKNKTDSREKSTWFQSKKCQYLKGRTSLPGILLTESRRHTNPWGNISQHTHQLTAKAFNAFHVNGKNGCPKTICVNLSHSCTSIQWLWNWMWNHN